MADPIDFFDDVEIEGDSVEDRKRAIAALLNMVDMKLVTKSTYVDFLEYHWPDLSRGAHRAFIQRHMGDEAPWNNVSKECPSCSTITEGAAAILREHGARNLGNNTLRAQSYCRDCR